MQLSLAHLSFTGPYGPHLWFVAAAEVADSCCRGRMVRTHVNAHAFELADTDLICLTFVLYTRIEHQHLVTRVIHGRTMSVWRLKVG